MVSDPDEHLRAAIKAAVDAGDLDRAGKLLEVLRGPSPAAAIAPLAPVVDLAARRRVPS